MHFQVLVTSSIRPSTVAQIMGDLNHGYDLHTISNTHSDDPKSIRKEIERVYEPNRNRVWLTLDPNLSHLIENDVNIHVDRSRFITLHIGVETDLRILLGVWDSEVFKTMLRVSTIKNKTEPKLRVYTPSEVWETAPNGMRLRRIGGELVVFDHQMVDLENNIRLFNYGTVITPQLNKILGKE